MRAWLIAPLGVGLILTAAGCGATQGERAGTGALGGIAFGTAVGGPIGAIVGGAVGAGVGAMRGTEDRLVHQGTQQAVAAVGLNKPENTAPSPSVSAPSAAQPARAAPVASGQDLRDAQQRLAQLGLYKGPIDGKYGPQTAAALNDFQAEHGLPRTGRLTPTTADRLQAEAGQGNPPETAQQPAPRNPPNAQTPGETRNPEQNQNAPGQPTNPPGQPTQ